MKWKKWLRKCVCASLRYICIRVTIVGPLYVYMCPYDTQTHVQKAQTQIETEWAWHVILCESRLCRAWTCMSAFRLHIFYNVMRDSVSVSRWHMSFRLGFNSAWNFKNHSKTQLITQFTLIVYSIVHAFARIHTILNHAIPMEAHNRNNHNDHDFSIILLRIISHN